MLIQKMNNAIKEIMNMKITDQMQKTLEDSFRQIQDKEHWKNPTEPEQITITFANFKTVIMYVGMKALSFNHFHGGYELNRIGDSDTIEIYSRGYNHYMLPINEDAHLVNPDW